MTYTVKQIKFNGEMKTKKFDSLAGALDSFEWCVEASDTAKATITEQSGYEFANWNSNKSRLKDWIRSEGGKKTA